MTERDAKTLNVAARHRFQDDLRHWKTRQGRFAAAQTANVSKNTVKAWKKIFKTHFRPAHIAWKRDSAF